MLALKIKDHHKQFVPFEKGTLILAADDNLPHSAMSATTSHLPCNAAANETFCSDRCSTNDASTVHSASMSAGLFDHIHDSLQNFYGSEQYAKNNDTDVNKLR